MSAETLLLLRGRVYVALAYLAFFSVGWVTCSQLVASGEAEEWRGGCLLALVAVTGGVMIWCYCKCVTTDPGYVPIASNSLSTPLDSSLSFSPLCSVCKVVKPPQTHHCKTCNRCVYRRDHHCPWINNCVGQFSQKSFVLFLVYGGAYHCLGLYILIYSVVVYSDYRVIVWVTIMTAFVAGVIITWSLAYQVYNVYFNLSGVESIQRQFVRRVSAI